MHPKVRSTAFLLIVGKNILTCLRKAFDSSLLNMHFVGAFELEYGWMVVALLTRIW